MALCATHEVPNCVQLHMPKIPYVEFAGGFEYFYLTWLKYELVFSALDFANEVFYLDAGMYVIHAFCLYDTYIQICCIIAYVCILCMYCMYVCMYVCMNT